MLPMNRISHMDSENGTSPRHNQEGWQMKKLVLLRHGQSVWNLENRFAGWTDVDLSDMPLQKSIILQK